MRKTYNLSKISRLLSYGIEDICNLYSGRNLHPQTVRKWIKQGLTTIDSKKPILIHGSDLVIFLQKLNEEHHTALNFDEFFCVACKEAHIPLHKTVYLEQFNSFIKAKGLCPITKKIMNRSYKLSVYSELKRVFNLEDMSRLYDSLNPASKTHINVNVVREHNESQLMRENLYDE